MEQNHLVEWEDDSRDLSTWKVLLVLLAGVVFGFLVLFADYHWWNGRHRDFARTGPFVLWGSLMCAQTGLWALALAWLAPSVRRLRELYGRVNRTEVVASTAIILALILWIAVVRPYTSTLPNYMPGHAIKVELLTLVGSLVALVAARGVWYVHGGLKQLAAKDPGTEETLETFLSLQNDLRRFLNTLGAILGLLILSTGAQRREVLAFAPRAKFGYELVLTYGFFFSILVAAIYLPTYVTASRVGNRILDAYFPRVSPASPEWEIRTAKREKLGAILELKAGPLAGLGPSAAILTPFVGSLIALILNR